MVVIRHLPVNTKRLVTGYDCCERLMRESNEESRSLYSISREFASARWKKNSGVFDGSQRADDSCAK